MGVLHFFENDIFISYAHIDNRPYADGHQGWVDKMHQDLARRLGEVIGQEPKIWRDPALTGSEFFEKTIDGKLANTAILVAVLSPRYVLSESCLKELKEFYRQSCEAAGIKIDTRTRIFKVVKTPIEEHEQPPELKGVLGYKFYEMDPQSGRPREFSHEIGFKTFEKFLQKLDDLAWDIKEFAKCQRATGKTVYLAETADDITGVRDQIRRELQFHGYCLLPDRDFPKDPADMELAIREDLRDSHLSIHLVGENYDSPAEGQPQSIVRLQHDLALQRGRDKKFVQLIWMPKGLKAKDAEQQKLIDDLRRDASTHSGVEVLQDRLEDLKTNILTKLKNLNKSEPPQPVPQGPVDIYLIHDGQDYEATAQLRKFLLEQQFELIPTVMEGDAAEVIQAHKENLKECDAAIVFHGKASEIWMVQKLRELRKSNGLGRATELLGKGLYISAPMTKLKEDYSSNEVTVMRDQGEFPPETLVKFLQDIRARANARNLSAKGVGK